MAVNRWPPWTWTGIRLPPAVPSPSCPYRFCPQPYASPSAVSAPVCRSPALIVAHTRSVATCAGLRLSVTEGCPTSPPPIPPQQYVLPAVVIPHVCQAPAEIIAQPCTTAVTSVSAPSTRAVSRVTPTDRPTTRPSSATPTTPG